MISKAVQQLMIGSVCNTEEKARHTLQRIRAAGYDSIELNGFMVKPTPFLVRALTKFAGMPTGSCGKLDWSSLVKEAGLSVCSLHEDLDSIENNLDSVISEAASFGTQAIVVTGMYRFPYGSLEEVKKLADRLSSAGQKLKENQLNLLYHNHNVEFSKFQNQSGGYLQNCAYRVLVEETNPEYVNFEFDSYWATDAGVNPLDVMQLLSERMVFYHITDRGCRLNGSVMTPIVKPDSVELGYGSLNIPGFLNAVKECGTQAVILESHKNWIDKDPVKSLELSGHYLMEHL